MIYENENILEANKMDIVRHLFQQDMLIFLSPFNTQLYPKPKATYRTLNIIFFKNCHQGNCCQSKFLINRMDLWV